MEREQPAARQRNEDLLFRLSDQGLVRSRAVREAMLRVDRGHYAPVAPYQDAPQAIGYGATISAPHMHAHSLELLAAHLRPGCRALDVGCGSGYLSACMARMVGPAGQVVAIDRVPELVELSQRNLAAADGDLLAGGSLLVSQGEGWQGFAAHAPYDAIHVGAAAEVVPVALKEQLRPGGRMVIPVGKEAQEFLQIDKGLDGNLSTKALLSVRYVPLVRPEVSQENIPARTAAPAGGGSQHPCAPTQFAARRMMGAVIVRVE
eukprot:CAMPEP_0171069852 /NCGR_PEP_ID=MMETSP0766_2-20121228/9399_1 /TAXON_ID=439317 /ORGANISM="Gambierdiscus australes, Strain CAWD 149" /LENGTH=261 /DNA_ID=CAMNT_0011526271 /DNA_START=50 /DNA_END=835 /DNA_ORIENTATION=+